MAGSVETEEALARATHGKITVESEARQLFEETLDTLFESDLDDAFFHIQLDLPGTYIVSYVDTFEEGLLQALCPSVALVGPEINVDLPNDPRLTKDYQSSISQSSLTAYFHSLHQGSIDISATRNNFLVDRDGGVHPYASRFWNWSNPKPESQRNVLFLGLQKMNLEPAQLENARKALGI